ncbi:hypothetical protein B0H67DRAFT_264224 [Lasiosphaeris hirsuta]|uniref:DUF7779 domain-containing protein n=1 Tax=Lasiosphaeris hirsuta TaxID=260670 RepID=A0AA40A7R8_9PEZI|nr:hypothetical protein B0H67DRAFT_264224 [Lasiosphaeris hirsuta]
MYRDSPSAAHAGLASYSMRPLYKHNLRSAYHCSFASLRSEERKVFGILSMSAADSIPLDMFLFKASDPNWPKQLGFCLRRTRLENTLEALLSSSLIARRDPETNTAFVHRIIQQEFCDFICEEERKESFMVLARLLKNNFPELINGVSLRKHWPTCLKYIHHVKALARRFEDYEYGDDDTEDFQDFAQVLAPAGW